MEEYKGYTIEIRQDELAGSPREWDNLGTMVCFHRRYNLGDDQPRVVNGEWLASMLDEHTDAPVDKDGYVTEHWDDFVYDLENDDPEATEKALAMLGEVLIALPLFLYDHGGLAMSTSQNYPFNCPWDAGQVGFIYVTKDDIRKEYSKQRISKKTMARALKVLRQEVSTYNQYLQGDVWWYNIEYPNGGTFDSCGGFFGYDYCLSEAKSQIDYERTK